DAQAMLANGKSAEGLKKKIDQLLTAKPSDPRLLLQRGIALSLLNRPAEAISVFQKLIESHPELPGPYNNLAVLYGNQGDYEKARQALELAIRTNPSYATAFQNLGDVYARLAGQAYKKALALDKSDGTLPLKLAVVQNAFRPVWILALTKRQARLRYLRLWLQLRLRLNCGFYLGRCIRQSGGPSETRGFSADRSTC
ncbi:tetratricopeptide repeat protein, partial [Roseateles sp. GG27B]